ncbi:MAG TPA: hypothetical protein VMY80_02800 [Anaerolineae bacterium]|nr:hypothetical protein [Anaerolineae bacterium]
MTGRERVRRALTFQFPDRVPRELWVLPGIQMFRQAEMEAVLARFPSDFVAPDVTYGVGRKTSGTPGVAGTYTDEWGCPFTVAEPGVIGEVKRPPLAEWVALDHLRPPDEILDQADFSRVDAGCAATDRFVKRVYSPAPAPRCVPSSACSSCVAPRT